MISCLRSDLPGLAGAATTGTLVLAAGLRLRRDLRAGVRARNTRSTEVLVHGTGGALATEEHGVRAPRRGHRELVEGEALTAGLEDAGTRGLGELERRNLELRHLSEAGV